MSADRLGDERVAGVLKAAVRVIVPVLELLADRDPLGLKKRTFREQADASGTKVDAALNAVASVFDAADTPGTKAWESMTVDQRVSWWVGRVGGIGTVAVAFPGIFGVLARRLPLGDVLGFANQAIVLVAVAREYGITEQDEQVRLLASVLCNRELPKGASIHAPEPDVDGVTDDSRVTEPSGRLSRSPFALLSTLWSVTKILKAVTDELDKRPRSRTVYRWLGNLPVVGAVAGYFGERGALSRAAKLGRRWVEQNSTSALNASPRGRDTLRVRKG
ncbi:MULTISPECIES: hypothetical protein [unclassified Rhodococcus (in: high G+C Gram-positive bacteria)]|uniref:hypothetical protein n=1 Tax=unclassified Rhodococcus (in: high G+C Gram-positive bacteria) TaxID=192944 RepID=UPI0006F4AF80|nr:MULTISPECIES: hypothetical protein [unclassified Rhodococcus (in: high G+C Gram-positive bacteria)]KQU39580.1 hypothetical protein ASG69_14565 [Rhodococcus sp. Leaf225]KQU44017.1 hypothetical protein ASH03_16240 [Rhodococcus sp. Leaf258]